MSISLNRLNKELKEYNKQNNSSDIKLYLRDDSTNIYNWEAIIRGPPDTPYSKGKFVIKIDVPQEYPISPPKCKFITKIFHPNIHFETGEICFELFLKDKWTPTLTIESVCRALIDLLSNPNGDSPLNCDCGNLIRCEDFIGYRSIATMYTIEYATDLTG